MRILQNTVTSPWGSSYDRHRTSILFTHDIILSFWEKTCCSASYAKYFLSQSFCRNSRPSRPLPTLIVRSLRWLIRGCRRNQGSMPSSPKVLMGGKIWKNSFTLKNSSEICTHRLTRARLPDWDLLFFFFTCFLRLFSSSSFWIYQK